MRSTLKGKKLELAACKEFICPNLNSIDSICNEIAKLKTTNNEHKTVSYYTEDQIKELKHLSRILSIEFFKKTYHCPNYSPIRIITACIYIASLAIQSERKVTQRDLTNITGQSSTTIRRRYNEIIKILRIQELPQEFGEADLRDIILKYV